MVGCCAPEQGILEHYKSQMGLSALDYKTLEQIIPYRCVPTLEGWLYVGIG
jgi:hypothetical protein